MEKLIAEHRKTRNVVAPIQSTDVRNRDGRSETERHPMSPTVLTVYFDNLLNIMYPVNCTQDVVEKAGTNIRLDSLPDIYAQISLSTFDSPLFQ